MDIIKESLQKSTQEANVCMHKSTNIKYWWNNAGMKTAVLQKVLLILKVKAAGSKSVVDQLWPPTG